MNLVKNIISMKFYFTLSVLLAFMHFSHADEKHKKDSMKAIVIREVMKKVSNITLNRFSKIPDTKKQIALNLIENKLRKSARGLSNSNKYIKFIMEEFKRKAFERKVNLSKQINHIENKNIERQVKNLQINKKSFNPEKENDSLISTQTKQVIITNIANKIESLAKVYLNDSQTLEQKRNILQKIEQKIIESSKRKHIQIHNHHSELKTYVNLIKRGLEMSIKRLLDDKFRRLEHIVQDVGDNNIITKNIHTANMEYIKQYKTYLLEVLNETVVDPKCRDVVNEICFGIESLHILSCGDDKIISLDQLCDGVPDCWSGIDEMNCIPQVTEKILSAISILSDIEQFLTTKCLQQTIDLKTFLHQHRNLQDMLKLQLRFIQNNKFTPTTVTILIEEESQENVDQNTDRIYLKKSITSVITSMTSLSNALKDNLCLSEESMPKINKFNTRKSFSNDSDDFKDYNNVKSKPTWSPKSCSCRQQFCTADDCDSRCKHVCWQKYILNRWACQSIDGDQSIPLNSICDGKLDCFDESDETACSIDTSHSKYEANKLYNDLIEILSLKSLSMEHEHRRNKILELIELVRQLQTLTTKHHVDMNAIRNIRTEYFNSLINIYDDMLTSNLNELNRNHKFLLILNQKMVYAMKRSHIGNENVVAPTGCYCINGKCALLRCPPKCIATCKVEPILTTYSCNANNASVYLKDICNGKIDCPNEHDEKFCIKDVCRSHHLVMLRHNLKKAGVTLKGTLLGEVLDAWKTKVMAALRVAENGERPNHKMLEDIIRNILHDLVTAYSSMEERSSKKNNRELVLREFKAMADIVIETLKTCGQ